MEAKHFAGGLLLVVAMFGLGVLAGSLFLDGDYHSGQQAIPAPGPIDIGFAQFMSLHHDQAVQMAGIILNNNSSELTGLARTIQYSQLLEIGQMQGWLNLWGKPLLPPSRDMGWMRLADGPTDPTIVQYLLDCETSPGGMPGLATTAQLQKLRTLSGNELDAYFLKLMIDHHRGGLPMARFAAKQAEIEVVRSLAERMFVAQSEELRLMSELLKRRKQMPPESGTSPSQQEIEPTASSGTR